MLQEGLKNPFSKTAFSDSKNTYAEIKRFYVNSTIEMRYAITDVEVQMQNIHSTTSEAVFDIIIPKEALVSNFSMVINGKTYQGKVKAKQTAKNIFRDSQVTSGLIQSETLSEFIDGKQVQKQNMNVVL